MSSRGVTSVHRLLASKMRASHDTAQVHAYAELRQLDALLSTLIASFAADDGPDSRHMPGGSHSTERELE